MKHKDIGIRYQNEELSVGLNKIFFKDIYEAPDVEIGVDGYLILDKNIKESLQQETLAKIHRMYKTYGIYFVRAIKSGVFNLVIHDKQLKKIFFVTDLFGRKPLYYRQDGKTLTVSPDIRDIKVPYECIDYVSVSQFLKYGVFLDNNTQYDAVLEIGPGTILEWDIDKGTKRISKYTYKMENVTDNYHKLFLQALDRLYTDELDYVLHLSAGLDSRYILANWKNKKDLVTLSRVLPESEIDRKELETATQLSKIAQAKDHVVMNRHTMSFLEMKDALKMFDPFDLRFVQQGEGKGYPINVTGGMQGMLSGSFKMLRHKKFILTLLTGYQFNTVSANVLDKAITKIPDDYMDYLSDDFKQYIISFPLSKVNYDIEEYHQMAKLRRFSQDRTKESLTPFIDYDLCYNTEMIQNRTNNKVYYKMLRTLPDEYKNVWTTSLRYPLSYPRRMQLVAGIMRQMKFMKQPADVSKEGVGALIMQKEDLKIGMSNEIAKDNLLKNEMSDLSGRKGYFFFLLFLIAYWLNNEVEK